MRTPVTSFWNFPPKLFPDLQNWKNISGGDLLDNVATLKSVALPNLSSVSKIINDIPHGHGLPLRASSEKKVSFAQIRWVVVMIRPHRCFRLDPLTDFMNLKPTSEIKQIH